MPVDGKLLEILCCPVSRTPLKRLSTEKLHKLNVAIVAGGVLDVSNRDVTEALSEALITDDMKVVYPVQGNIPLLLEESGIGTAQLMEFL